MIPRLTVVVTLLVLLFQGTALAETAKRQTLPQLAAPFAAVDFELAGEDGSRYRLSDYRGKVVVLNFWATWCPPCREEMPSLERAWQQLKGKDVVILAVNVGESAESVFEFTGNYPMSFPIPLDREGAVIKSYPVTGLPTTYVVSPDGRVTHRAVGSRVWDSPEIIAALLALRD